MRRSMILALVLGLALPALRLSADAVTLTDGTVLKGTAVKLDNGDVKVDTAAGTITVPKDKVASMISDAAAPQDAGMTDYERKVYEKRRKAGNEDGIPHSTTSDFHSSQVNFGLGYSALNSDILDRSGGKYGRNDLNGLAMQLQLLSSGETFGLEMFTAFTVGQTSLSRLDLGINPRVQLPMPLGGGKFLVPHASIGPVVSAIFIPSTTDWAVGGNVNVGLDFQSGPVVVSAAGRYIMAWDTANTFNPDYRNVSSITPMLSVGYAF
jgi:hypothetical protein